MKCIWRHIALAVVRWTIIGLLVMCLLVTGLMYVPGVLDRVADRVLPMVEKSSGMKIKIGDLRLSFPFDLTATDATVLEASGDTMVVAGRLNVNVNPLRLITGDIAVRSATLSNAMYRMGAPDSMYLRADVKQIYVHDARMNIKRGSIDVGYAALDGGRVNLVIGQDSTAAPADSSASSPLTIRAGEIRLRDLDYSMTMMPVIDTLTARIGDAALISGVVDMVSKRISAQSLVIDSVGAIYLTPSAAYKAEHPLRPSAVKAEPAPSDGMWQITAEKIALTNSNALYGMAGAEPQPGLDMNYLQVRDINIDVDSFRNCGSQIRVPLRRLSGTERSGIEIDASGLFAMDTAAMHASGFLINTLYSSLNIDAEIGLDTVVPAILSVDATASVGLPDIMMAMPMLKPLLSAAPLQTPLTAGVQLDGTMSDIHINQLELAMQRCFSASLSGIVENADDPDNLSGNIKIDGKIINAGFLKPTLVQAKMGLPVNLPPLTMSGNVKMDRGAIDGRLTAVTGGGRVALNAGWNGRPEAYRLTADIDSFPVRTFLPTLGIGTVTAEIKADGHGLNFMSAKSVMNASVNIRNIEYDQRVYRNIDFDAKLAEGRLLANLGSDNKAADLSLAIDATLSDTMYTWKVDGNVRNLDLRAMGLADTVMQGRVRILSAGNYAPDNGEVHATLDAEDLKWNIGDAHLNTSKIAATFNSDDSMTTASLINKQLQMHFEASESLDSLLAKFTQVSDTVNAQIARKRLEMGQLQHLLPQMELHLTAGADNLINDYLSASNMSFGTLEMGVRNRDKVLGGVRVTGFRSGDNTRLDTIGIKLVQEGDSMVYAARIDNRPGTMDAFAHVLLNGSVEGNSLSTYIRQRNIADKTGYHLGLTAKIGADSVVTVSLRPFNPIIAYKQWTVNEDNYIAYNLVNKEFDAHLDMAGNGSRLQLTTERGDTTGAPENVMLKVTDVKLSDWLAMSPFAPPVKGNVSADLKIRYNTNSVWGDGTIGLKDLTYGKERVGSFDLGVDIATNTKGVVNAEVALMIDSIKTITAVGAINDSTKANPFDLDFTMIRMPLRVVNPFLPKGTVKLSGMLNGNMQITGTLGAPVFNGYIDFDSSAVNVAMIGTDFKFSEEKVKVDSNLVKFEDYTITGVNNNPLYINGTVDMNMLSNPRVDLAFKANGMQVVGGNKRKGVNVYGKAFVNLDAKVNGNMNFMAVDADVTVLRSTNVTYIMADATPASLGLQDTDDMVKFVNFSDSLAVAVADTMASSDMAIMVDAVLNVDDGSTINVDLSTDGSNKVQVQSNGTLNYSLSPFGDSRVTGRLNINQGFVRYTPPFISEKLFRFQNGSYVSFNGDMMNPILNIHADETLKANVTREGENSRLVNFDIELSVTGTLQDMNVAFNLSTNDDITVQNELQAMSAEQRANQAMNMLLYNVYTGPGTKGNSNLSGNPLFSFLESQLNSWAANNIKGVDVSFGIDQYNQTRDGATSSTMSYSYQVSKSLFNDRFKIVVGGNYSTDANADENFSQNLINDISFEYMLNRSGSMYVKLFRHTGYESILEGEITQTGVGFVYKHKLRRLGDMFRFLTPKRKSRTPEPAVPAAAEPSAVIKTADDDEQ